MQELRSQFERGVANLTSARGVPTKFKEIDVGADGSCFFHAVGHFLGMDGHDLRRLTARFIIEFADAEDASGIKLNEFIPDVHAYAHELEHNNMWGGANEMKALLLASNGRLRINVYKRNADQGYEPVHKSTYTDANVHLLYWDNVHYRVLVPVVPASRPQSRRQDTEILLARLAREREHKNHLARLAQKNHSGDNEFATFLVDAETIKRGDFVRFAIAIVTEDFEDYPYSAGVVDIMQKIEGFAAEPLRELERYADLIRFVKRYGEACKKKIEAYLESEGADKEQFLSLKRLGNIAN